MSRRALWPEAANGADQSPTAASAAPHAHGRAVLAQVGAGAGTPDMTSSPEMRALEATGRDVGAVLARMAELHEGLARACRDLQNQLAVRAERALMCDVQTAPTRRRLMTIQDIAELLQVDARTVRRMRARGQLPPAIDLHSVVRWDEATIVAWIEGRRES